MKTFPQIKIGNYTIETSAEYVADSIIAVTVKRGNDSLTGKLNHSGPHDHTEAQFEKDVNDFARRLATELAGKMRSKELAKKFTSD